MGIKDIAEGALLQSALIDSLEREFQIREIITLQILTDDFGFTQDQINDFVDAKMKKMQEARQSQLNVP